MQRRKQASHSAVDGNSLTAQVQEHKHLNMKQYRFSECFPSLVTLSAFLVGAAEPGLKFSPSQTATVENSRGAWPGLLLPVYFCTLNLMDRQF